MTKFVYVSNDYREAWKTYVHNFEGMWEEFDKDFEIDFLYKLQEEEHSLKENTRPSSVISQTEIWSAIPEILKPPLRRSNASITV